ncbi:MAG: SpoIIE family protein phosphatase [Lachnospiraceae bacterium]|nr:SpoIIE family protein phosphatase [Lachnospiraceae bacterium]
MKNEKSKSLKGKILFVLVVCFVALWLLISLGVSAFYRVQMEEEYSANAYSLASIAANYVDGDTINNYRDTLQKDDYYAETLDFLRKMREDSGIKYLYIVIPQETGYFYIWDAGDPDVEEGVCDLGDFDNYYQSGEQAMKAAFNEPGKTREMLVTDNAVYGYVASAFVPVYDSQGRAVALSSVDVSMDDVNSEIRSFLGVITGFMVLAILVACTIFYNRLHVTVIEPIGKLHTLTESFVADQMKKGETLETDIQSSDEIGGLARSFESMSVELRNYMKEFEHVTKENARISTELNVATQIQADMLPRIFPPYPDRSEFDIFASMDPAKEVGGDFYDFFLIDDDHIALVMADVSGKGVPAALFMVIAKTLIKNRAMMGGGPGQILTDVNSQLCEGNEAELFVTVWLAIIEISTGKGKAANAGHEHPVLRKAGGDFELVVYRHSPAVATMDGIPFREHDFEIGKGDTIFVYTDGVAEATDANNELFGTDRMLEALNSEPDADPEKLLKNVRDGVDAFVGDADQFDDLTMLAFKLR